VIGQCLSNKNENAKVAKTKFICELNKALLLLVYCSNIVFLLCVYLAPIVCVLMIDDWILTVRSALVNKVSNFVTSRISRISRKSLIKASIALGLFL